KAGSAATPPVGPGKMLWKKRSVSTSASVRRLEAVTKNAGRRNSCAMCAAASAFATSCSPDRATRLPPERNAATAPSIAGWRNTASSRSRTAGRIMLDRSGLRSGGRRPFANFLQDGGRRVPRHDRDRYDAAARSLDFFPSDDLAELPVSALYEYV